MGIKQIIVITGTPGTGKSSISRLLSAQINARIINIGKMIQEEHLTSGFDKRRGTPIADLKLTSNRIVEIIKSERDSLIFEGHYAPSVVPISLVDQTFVLRREPNDLRMVLENRGYKEEKVYENVAAEILDVCLWEAINTCGPEKVCEIDITGKTAEDVIETIILVLEKKEDCVTGKIDWLSKIESEGKTDQYLRRL